MYLIKIFSLKQSFLRKAICTISMLSLSATAFALPSDRNQPISLVADKATYSEATGVTTYTGNVIIEQGTMKLQASSIVAQLNKSKQISTITATGGPAKFQQQVDSAKGVARGEAQ
ncbi:lipopolysaccharide transport periplasmic protein LptA, partial [Nakamurella silvestris]